MPWEAVPYRPSGTRATWAQVLLALSGVVAALGAMLQVQLLTMTDTIDQGRFDLEAYESTASLLALLGVAQVMLILATAFAFIAWQSRVTDDIPALGLGTPRWSPRWTIVAWFLPLANLVLPVLAMRDVARRLPGGPWTLLMAAWWVLWVVAGIIDRALANDPGPTVETVAALQAWLRRILLVATTGQLAFLGAAIMGILVVRRMEQGVRRAAATRPPEWRRPPDASTLPWEGAARHDAPATGWPDRSDRA